MRILPISTQNNKNNYSKNTNFKGITKKLSHHMFIDGKKDIVELLNRTHPKNTKVGELPPILFNALPTQNRPQQIKHIMDTFAEVSEEIMSFKPNLSAPRSERQNRRPDTTVQKLKQIFIDLKLLKEDDPFDLIYLGEGNYKKAYKLEGVKDPKNGDELCLKVFHLVDKTPEWHKYKTHGNFAELNTSAYWKTHEGMYTQRNKFYFGDVEHGYFVDRFIDSSVTKPKNIIDEHTYGIKLTDEVNDDAGHNRIHGYSIDPGGPRVVNRVKNESKTARMIFDDIEATPKKYRMHKWYQTLADKTLDKRQKEAGLAISIKHMQHRSPLVEECLKFNNPFADVGLAYVLKYLKQHNADKYFTTLMKRNDPTTQTVLLNEIPLLARRKIKIDDLDVPKGEINQERLAHFYKIAQKHVRPEIEQHLASYIHLLPREMMIPEAEKLISRQNYEINDRLLHKIKFVKDEEFSFGDKMAIIQRLEKEKYQDMPKEQADFLREKTRMVKTYIIRNQLDD